MPMDHVKVSVVIPIYNVGKYLPRCLDSLLGQSLKDIELICVDDCSKDDSTEVLKRYAEKDSRVRLVLKQQNEGTMMARRSGYENAVGQYVFFCDPDDFVPAGALEALYRRSVETAADIVVGRSPFYRPDGSSYLPAREYKVPADAKEYVLGMLHWGSCSLCGRLFKRCLFDGGPYETFRHCLYSEDRMLLLQLLHRHNPSIASLPEDVYYYCINEGSATRMSLTYNRLEGQLFSLSWCHSFVEKNFKDEPWGVDNDGFFTRYIGLYVESGYNVDAVCDYNMLTERLSLFSQMRRNVGLKLALHFWSCFHLPGYSSVTHSARRLIRKLQGKG